MLAVSRGKEIELALFSKNASGDFYDPISITADVCAPNGTVVLQDVVPVRIDLGVWTVDYSTSQAAALGFWRVVWKVSDIAGNYQQVEYFEVVERSAPMRSPQGRVEVMNRGEKYPLLLQLPFAPAGGVDSVELALTDVTGAEIHADNSPEQITSTLFRSWVEIPFEAQFGVAVASWSIDIDGNVLTVEYAMEILEDKHPQITRASSLPSVDIGNKVDLDAMFINHQGLLFDPDDLKVAVIDPSGLTVIDLVPNRLAAGVYRTSLPLGLLGVWRIRWYGDENTEEIRYLDAVRSVAVDPSVIDFDGSHPFLASVNGVRKHIPYFRIDELSQPNFLQVGEMIDGIAAEVQLRIGAYTSAIQEPALVNRITDFARQVTEIGAAASVEDAAFAMRSTPNDSTYGSRLWERYNRMLEALIALVAEATPGEDPGAGVGINSGIGSFPPPQFTTWMQT